jgi:putative tricarboxylic transport membrane protein
MLASNGSLAVFWSNGLVGSICALAIAMLLWPVIGALITAARKGGGGGGGKPAARGAA